MSARPLWIIGGGLSRGHITDDARVILGTVEVVFYSRYNRFIPELLADINPHAVCVDLDAGEYRLRDYRPRMYERMANAVIDQYLAGRRVALVEPGSAVVLDAITQFVIVAVSRKRGSVQVVPGISAVECILTALHVDPSFGLQIGSAQSLFSRRQRLDPKIAAIILQPAYYDTALWLGSPHSRPQRFRPLIKYLLDFYEPSQPMAVIKVADYVSADVLWFRLRNLIDVAPCMDPFHTLFLPAATKAGPIDATTASGAAWPTVSGNLLLTRNGMPRQRRSRYGFASLKRRRIDIAHDHVMLARAWARRRRA